MTLLKITIAVKQTNSQVNRLSVCVVDRCEANIISGSKKPYNWLLAELIRTSSFHKAKVSERCILWAF